MGVAKFKLGTLVCTPAVAESVSLDEQLACIIRHVMGDWGDLGRDDKRANERAIKEGDRILSKYKLDNGGFLYVLTEHDRSLTSLLFPHEY